MEWHSQYGAISGWNGCEDIIERQRIYLFSRDESFQQGSLIRMLFQFDNASVRTQPTRVRQSDNCVWGSAYENVSTSGGGVVRSFRAISNNLGDNQIRHW